MRVSGQPSPIKTMMYQKELESVEYFNCLCSVITNDARCTREIKSKIVMATAALNKKKALLTSKLDLNIRKKLVNCYIWSIAFCGAGIWILQKADQKYLESFEMWCCRRMGKISWTDRVRNEEVLHRGEEYPTYSKKKEG
jgi:hypothetical protein